MCEQLIESREKHELNSTKYVILKLIEKHLYRQIRTLYWV